MRLGEVADARNNNFNLIRMAAALAVLASHCYPLTGQSADEPIAKLHGMTLGDIAVDVFFFASGLLVTGSLVKRRSGKAFLRARVLRIYPGLWAMLAVVVFGLGAVLSQLSPSQYFGDVGTWKYLVRDALLFAGITHTLPGVFIDNPYPFTVNGSLWTMSFEVRLYLALALIWVVLRIVPVRRDGWFQGLVLVAAVGTGVAHIGMELQGTIGDWQSVRLSAPFFAGAGCYILRGWIKLHASIMFALVAALVMAAWSSRPAFIVSYDLLLGWLVLHAAYLSKPVILMYNRLGDYSYGVYIYAFPVQQTVAHFIPTIGAVGMFCISAPMTLALAILSWHWIEKSALAKKPPRLDQADDHADASAEMSGNAAR